MVVVQHTGKWRRCGRETLTIMRWEERQPWCVPYASLSGGRKKERRGGSLDEGGVRAAVSPKEKIGRGSGTGMRARIKSRLDAGKRRSAQYTSTVDVA